MKKILFVIVLLVIFSVCCAKQDARAKDPALSANEMKYLNNIEDATFRGFEKLIDPAANFPVDIASISSGDVVRQPENEYFSKTSPTNIGLGFLYVTLAKERGYLTEDKAYERALRMMDTLEKLETYEGFLYNWYYLNEKKGAVPEVCLNRFISSLDNGDMDISLMAAAGAFPDTELAARIDSYLQKKNYRFFYDKNSSGASRGMINAGFDQAAKKYNTADYSIFNIEARMTVLIAILKDKLPDSAWTEMSRLVKTYKTLDGKSVSVVAPWGGSLYETLFADEIMGGFKVAPKAFKTNAFHMIQIHRDHGMKVSKTGIWGFSNGEVPAENRYEMVGVPEIAYNRFSGEFVTAYSSFLSLRYAPIAVIENLKNMEALNPKVFNRKYGFTDSIDPRTGTINLNILSLDKGMELLSIANYMNSLEGKKEIPDYLWDYFKRKGWDTKAGSLFKAEEANPSFQAITERTGPQSFSAARKDIPVWRIMLNYIETLFHPSGEDKAKWRRSGRMIGACKRPTKAYFMYAASTHPTRMGAPSAGTQRRRWLLIRHFGDMLPIDVIEARKEIGSFYEPDRANASFRLVDSDKKGKQIVEVLYDVTNRYSFSGLYIKLGDLDISDYKTFSVQIKGDGKKGFPETVKVELKSKGQYVAFDHVRINDKWEEANITLPPGKKKIDEITFVFENAASVKHPKGKVDIRSLILK